jgi:hypothetical protein
MANHDPIKNQKWRLGVIRHFEEVTHNVSKTCPYFGISRNAFYKWQRRYLELGEEGLIDRSRLPIHSPRATKPEILAKIIYLRQTFSGSEFQGQFHWHVLDKGINHAHFGHNSGKIQGAVVLLPRSQYVAGTSLMIGRRPS